MGVTRRGDGIAEPPRQPPQDHLSRTTPRRRSRETAAGGGGAENSSSAPLSKIGSERGFNRPRNLSNVFFPAPRRSGAPSRQSAFWIQGEGAFSAAGFLRETRERTGYLDGRAQNPRCYPKFKLFARASAAHTRAQHDVRHGTRRHHAQDDGGSRERRDDGSHVDFPNAERTHERVERGDPIERERRTKRGCFEVRRVRADRRGTRRDAVARAVPALPAPRARRDRLRALTPDPPSRARSPQTPPRRPHGLSLAPSTMTCQRC